MSEQQHLPVVLATAAYHAYRDGMGVPVCTSIGKHPGFPTAPQVNSLKPWTTFKKMTDRPVEEQQARYQRQLDETVDRVLADVRELSLCYPGVPLILLCWCNLDRPDIGPMGCHRRWAADWFVTRGLVERVPDLFPLPTREERGQQSLF